MVHLVLYIIVLLAALANFGWLVYGRLRALGAARSADTRGDLGQRLSGVLVHVLGQRRLLHGDFRAGLMHFFIFWGFVVLGLNSLLFLINGFLPQGGWLPPLLERQQPLGAFYILLRDIFEVLVLAAVGYAAWRRLVVKPKRLKLSWEGVLILGLIALLMLTGMLMDGAMVALGDFSAHPLSFAEQLFGRLMSAMPYSAVKALAGLCWWLHLLTFLVFLNLLPVSKHFHILTSVFKVYLRNLDPPGRLSKVNFEDESVEEYGVSRISQFTWSNWLDAYSCTECGRCDSFCPAHQTGKVLSPQHIITDTREEIYGHLPAILKLLASPSNARGSAQMPEGTEALVGEVHVDAALWACTTCGACDTHCPLFIEHVTPIVEMRRHLVLEQEGRFPKELASTFRGLEGQGNPWGIAAHKRLEWAEGLEVPTLADKPDAEYIYFVGCFASFDERNKVTARALVELLIHAGVSFAVLEAETCCGDPARRCGHEYLAQSLIEVNAEQFKAAKPKKVLTACPHCFNTLKHEYSQFGVEFDEVLHHTQLISRLMNSGKLRLPENQAHVARRVVYHDSCYLGRYNEIYYNPRDIVRSVRGNDLVEAEYSGDKGYCCGAGGGRMFMEETEGERVNTWRYEQLAATGAETICTACPFCMTMLDDAAKDSGEAAKPVLDVAVLLRDAILGE